jgi:AcrR family transcriptional regulator
MPFPVRNAAPRDKIVAAAAQLFASQGYHGTSTREIAHLASVSENTIFRHFACKEDLFWLALRDRCSAVKLRSDVVEGMIADDAPEVVLPMIVEFLYDVLNYSPDVLRLIAVALLEMQWKADAFSNECLTPAFSAISRYMAGVLKKKQMHNVDPVMITAAIITTVLVYPWFSRHTLSSSVAYADSRAAQRAYTNFWLGILSPWSTTSAPQLAVANGIACMGQ